MRRIGSYLVAVAMAGGAIAMISSAAALSGSGSWKPELLDALRQVVVIKLEDDPQAVRLLLKKICRKEVEAGDWRGRRSELHPPLRLDQHATVIEARFFERDNS